MLKEDYRIYEKGEEKDEKQKEMGSGGGATGSGVDSGSPGSDIKGE